MWFASSAIAGTESAMPVIIAIRKRITGSFLRESEIHDQLSVVANFLSLLSDAARSTKDYREDRFFTVENPRPDRIVIDDYSAD